MASTSFSGGDSPVNSAFPSTHSSCHSSIVNESSSNFNSASTPFSCSSVSIPQNENLAALSFSSQLDTFALVLCDHNSDWKQRIANLVALQRLLLDDCTLTRNTIAILLKEKISHCLCRQLEDRRSAVPKAACETVSTIARRLQFAFDPLAAHLLPTLLRLLAFSVHVIADSAFRCVRSFVSLCTYHSLPILLKGTCDPHPIVRCRCAQFIADILTIQTDGSHSNGDRTYNDAVITPILSLPNLFGDRTNLKMESNLSSSLVRSCTLDDSGNKKIISATKESLIGEKTFEKSCFSKEDEVQLNAFDSLRECALEESATAFLTSVHRSLSDSSPAARASARQSFAALQRRWPVRALSLFQKLDPAIQKTVSEGKSSSTKQRHSLKQFIQSTRQRKTNGRDSLNENDNNNAPSDSFEPIVHMDTAIVMSTRSIAIPTEDKNEEDSSSSGSSSNT